MPFKKTNMILPIFIIVLLLALYIFTTNSANRTNKIKDTFRMTSLNNDRSWANGVNSMNGVNGMNGVNSMSGVNGMNGVNSMNGVNGMSGVNGMNGVNSMNGANGRNGENDSTNNSIINNKIRIINRDNSLLQQYIKSDSSNNEKEHFDMIGSFENNSSNNEKGHFDTITTVPITTVPITTVPIANTLINNDKYKGYNNYVSLRTDSYAPVTSIGKQLITPYASYPIAS